MISVSQVDDADPLTFDVRVDEGSGETRHSVTMYRYDFERMAPDECSPQQCVEAAFRFLLDREPKEAIMARFDIAVIPRFFPEFETELPRYISAVCGSPGGR